VTEIRRFDLAGQQDPSAIVDMLTDRFGLQLLGEEQVTRIVVDTADNRIAAAGGVLEVRRSADGFGSGSLIWISGGTQRLRIRLSGDETPASLSDIGDTHQADELIGIAGTRPLVAAPTIRSGLYSFGKLDDEDKTVVRVLLDCSSSLDGLSSTNVIEVQPRRGYDEEYRTLVKELSKGLKNGKPRAATAAANAPTTPGSGPRSASQAWREALRSTAEVMTSTFVGMLAGDDSEFLHDFRIGVRRTRVLLHEAESVIDDERRLHFAEEFKWLGEITTPTRDADVHLDNFSVMAAGLRGQAEADLAPLRELLLERQVACRAQMLVDMRSERRTRFATEWSTFLADDQAWSVSLDEPLVDATKPAFTVIADRTRTAWRHVQHDGRLITDESLPTDLHDLRKEAKRLRYLLESFAPQFHPKSLKLVKKSLRSMQDVLGEFQDSEVQAVTLAAMAEELVARGAAAPTILAIEGTVKHLAVRSLNAREKFSERFNDFDSRGTRRAFKRLTQFSESSR
jgi:CHAD domain-containing protein